jgi:hypothetical protein
VTATLPARTEARYRGVIYGIDVLDHETRQVMPNDYVGKTRQKGRARENQHRDDQPWSDLIVGSSHVLWEGICTEAELDEMERRFIQDVEVRPRMNWKLNEDNPEHIPKWVQREQRWARDDALRRQRWVPVDEREPVSLLDMPMRQSTTIVPERRVSVPRKWSPVQVKAVLWSGAWLLLTGIGWGECARHGHWSTRTDAISGGVTAALVMVWGLWRKPDSWKLWKRRLRRLRRAL